MTEKEFPDKGILWRGWNDDTLRIIQEKNRPVLLFVADTDPFVWPFLREIFKAMPANARLRQLLNDFYPAMFIKADFHSPGSQGTRRRQQLPHRSAVALWTDADGHDRNPAQPGGSRPHHRRNSRTSRRRLAVTSISTKAAGRSRLRHRPNPPHLPRKLAPHRPVPHRFTLLISPRRMA